METTPPAPGTVPVHIRYSLYPVKPENVGDPEQLELKVHVARGHHYKDRVWMESMTPEVARLLDEMGKVAADLQAQLG